MSKCFWSNLIKNGSELHQAGDDTGGGDTPYNIARGDYSGLLFKQ